MENIYFIYIITNKNNHVLYTGVTNNLVKRIWEHKNKIVKGFSYKYNLSKLVYYEVFSSIREAIKREKQLKSGSRNKKLNLIISKNPFWKDLYESL